ncbi:TPA: hypothetical protein ACKP9G_003706 [Pseudomonas aeruginosa]
MSNDLIVHGSVDSVHQSRGKRHGNPGNASAIRTDLNDNQERRNDFSDALRKRGIEEVNTPLDEQKMNEKSSRAVRQALRILRKEKDDREARIEYHETVGMLRGLYYGGEIDSMELVALTQLAGNAYINAGKPW